MTGCLEGRGETVISICGCEAANLGSVLRRKELNNVLEKSLDGGGKSNILHSSGTAGPVAIVEIETFALEDEGADAILSELLG